MTTPTTQPTEQPTNVRTAEPAPLYRILAGKIAARQACQNDPIRQEWYRKHSEAIDAIARNLLPSGSGIDGGTKVDLDRSTGERIVLTAGFHHMNDAGMYDGWTEHNITITPSLLFTMHVHVSGRNRNGIKEYMTDVYSSDLHRQVIESYDVEADRTTFRFADW